MTHRTALREEPSPTGPKPLSTTHAELRRWRFGLYVGITVVAALTMVVFGFARDTVDTVHDDGLTAVVSSLNAANAVASANQAVATNFATANDVALTGPGRDYQADLDLATQSLEQVAGANQADTEGSQAIESVDGQLATYMELIEHADAYYARGENTAGAAETWHAAQLMDTDGVLADLGTLRDAELSAVDEQGSSFATGWAAVLLWLLPTVLLLAGLIVAQVYLSRRFRRSYNWPLVLASALVVVIGAGSALLIASDGDFGSARAELHTVVTQRQAVTSKIDADGMTRMVSLVVDQCHTRPECGTTIATAQRTNAANNARLADVTDRSDSHLAAARAELDSAAAASSLGYLVGLFVAAVCTALLVMVGFRPRINEYRFQS